MRTFWLIAIALIVSTTTVRAQVILNEVSPRTDPEWVELYNKSGDPVDLTNWRLVDKANNERSISSLGIISPATYLVFTTPKGWLNDSGEEHLYLYSPSQVDPIDSLSYTSIKEGMTVARLPNLTGSWLSDQSPSMGYANSEPSPSPSPAPSVVVSPSPSPSVYVPPSPVSAQSPATPTPTPTPPPVGGSTVSPSSTPKLSLKPSATGSLASSPMPSGEVAGATTEINLEGFGVSPTPTSSPQAAQSSRPTLNKERAKTAIMVGTGLVLISIAGFFGYRKYLKSKSESNDSIM